MKTISAHEAKTQLYRLLDEVAQGEEVTITKHGKPVARLIPVGRVRDAQLKETVARLKSFRKGHRLESLTIKGLIEEKRR